MAPTITGDNLGAWLVKGNPETSSDLPSWIQVGGTVVRSWCVVPGYRAEMMAAGDRVILWVSGNGRRVARGIWGMGHVTGPVEEMGPKPSVPLHLPLLDQPVPAHDLVAAGITDLEVQRMPQGSNPSWASRHQLARLMPLVPPWPDH